MPIFGGNGKVGHCHRFFAAVPDERALTGGFKVVAIGVVNFEIDLVDCIEGVHRPAFRIVAIATEHGAGGGGGLSIEELEEVLGLGILDFWSFEWIGLVIVRHRCTRKDATTSQSFLRQMRSKQELMTCMNSSVEQVEVSVLD